MLILASLSWISYLLLAIVLGFFVFIVILGIVNRIRGKRPSCGCDDKGKALLKAYRKSQKNDCPCCQKQNGSID